MKQRNFKFQISNLALFIAAIIHLMIAGCGPQIQKEQPLCAGKATAAQAVAALQQKQTAQLSLQSAIHCDIEISNPLSDPIKENFDGKMVFVGPDNLRIGGSKFGPIQIGANANEFWYYVKPGLDTARWGETKNATACTEKLGFNPCYLADALGQIDLDRDWTLTQQPGLDILSAPEPDGIKKVYINCCSYHIERIEYCDIMGNLAASADLSDYRDVPKVGSVPRVIELRHFHSARIDTFVRLRLSNPSFFEPPAIQKKFFERPQPKGYKAVYRLTENCEFVAD
jgi:hypothetical protein